MIPYINRPICAPNITCFFPFDNFSETLGFVPQLSPRCSLRSPWYSQFKVWPRSLKVSVLCKHAFVQMILWLSGFVLQPNLRRSTQPLCTITILFSSFFVSKFRVPFIKPC
jgi:hypothetical protein